MRQEHDSVRRGSFRDYGQEFETLTDRVRGRIKEVEDDEPYCSRLVLRLADACGFLAFVIALGTVAYLAVLR